MTGTLVVTGGGGFVGSYTAQHFAKDGWKVLAFDNLSRTELLGGKPGPIPPTYNWERLGRLEGVRRVKGDKGSDSATLPGYTFAQESEAF